MDAAAKHENRYRAVIEYANGAMFNVAELDIWAVSNKVSVYWLTAQAHEAAFLAGARGWIEDVKTAASKRRKGADKIKATAAKLDKMRRIDPRQGGLFDQGGEYA